MYDPVFSPTSNNLLATWPLVINARLRVRSEQHLGFPEATMASDSNAQEPILFVKLEGCSWVHFAIKIVRH